MEVLRDWVDTDQWNLYTEGGAGIQQGPIVGQRLRRLTKRCVREVIGRAIRGWGG